MRKARARSASPRDRAPPSRHRAPNRCATPSPCTPCSCPSSSKNLASSALGSASWPYESAFGLLRLDCERRSITSELADHPVDLGEDRPGHDPGACLVDSAKSAERFATGLGHSLE